MSRTNDAVTSNAKDVTDDVKAFGHDVLRLAGALGEEARAQVGDMNESVVNQSKAAFSDVRKRIGANPALALGMTVGVGVLVGFLLNGRR